MVQIMNFTGNDEDRNERIEDYFEEINLKNRDIYKALEYQLCLISIPIIMQSVFNDYSYFHFLGGQDDDVFLSHDASEQSKNDFSLLKEFIKEINDYINNYEVNYNDFFSVTTSLDKAFVDFKIQDAELRKKCNSHPKKKYLTRVIRILFLNESAWYCYRTKNYRACMGYNYTAMLMLKWLELDLNKLTPIQKNLVEKQKYIIPLAQKIWELDKDKHLLFSKQVAKIIIDLTNDNSLTETQLKNWFKDFNIIPLEIIERDKNNDYGNTKAEKKQREELIAKIKEELKDYCENIVNNDP